MRLRFIKMEINKVMTKLEELKKNLVYLRKINRKEGEGKFDSYRDLLNRIIDRIYPEKDAKELKEKLIHKHWAITGNETEEYWQKFYMDKIDLSLRVINTIIEEWKIFGFDDFKPIKEKVETEA